MFVAGFFLVLLACGTFASTVDKQVDFTTVCEGQFILIEDQYVCISGQLVGIVEISGGSVAAFNDTSIWQDLTNLLAMGIQNPIEPIPLATELGLLTNLAFLLSGNGHYGTIPTELGQLTSLQMLTLLIDISGSIPSEIGQLSDLIRLQLSDSPTPVTGTVPSQLFALTKMDQLTMGNLGIGGPLPSLIGQLSKLVIVRLDGNKFSGTLATEIGLLTDCKELKLGDNLLEGPLPSELGLLTIVTHITFYNNRLTSSIPSQLAQLTSLNSISLRENRFSGTLPSVVQVMGLDNFDLSYNGLEGVATEEFVATANCYKSGLRNPSCFWDCAPCALLEVEWADCDSRGQGQVCLSVFYFLPVLPIFALFVFLALRVVLPGRKMKKYVAMTYGTCLGILGSVSEIAFGVTAVGWFQPMILFLVGGVLVWSAWLSVTKISKSLAAVESDGSWTFPDLHERMQRGEWLYAFSLLLCIVNINLLSTLICSDPTRMAAFKSQVQFGSLLFELPQFVVQLLFLSKHVTLAAIVASGTTTLSLLMRLMRATMNRSTGAAGGLSPRGQFSTRKNSSGPSDASDNARAKWGVAIFMVCSVAVGVFAMPSVADLAVGSHSQQHAKTNQPLITHVDNEPLMIREQIEGFVADIVSKQSTVSKQSGIEACADSLASVSVALPYVCGLGKAFALIPWNSEFDVSYQPGFEDLFAIMAQNFGDKTPLASEMGLARNLIVWSCRSVYSGQFPSEIGLLSSLRMLVIDELPPINQTLPSELGQLTDVTDVALDLNGFVGQLPSQMMLLRSVQRLDLTRNFFSGTVASEVGNLEAAVKLSLHSNRFSGAIPSQLGLVSGLTHLNLARNLLEGTIPIQLSRLTNMVHLYLSHNLLTGTLPTELGLLTRLTTLEVEGNMFVGTVPLSIQGVEWLYLGSNRFQGAVDIVSPNLYCDFSGLSNAECSRECAPCSTIEFELKSCNEEGLGQECVPGYYGLPFVACYAVTVALALRKFAPKLRGGAFVLAVCGLVFGMSDLVTDVAFAFVSSGTIKMLSLLFLGAFACVSLGVTLHAFRNVTREKNEKGEYTHASLRRLVVKNDFLFALALSFCVLNFRLLTTVVASDSQQTNRKLKKRVMMTQVFLETLPQLVMQVAAIASGQRGFFTFLAVGFTGVELLVEFVRVLMGVLRHKAVVKRHSTMCAEVKAKNTMIERPVSTYSPWPESDLSEKMADVAVVDVEAASGSPASQNRKTSEEEGA